jgi:F0F1-type ATP synthase assembly protein I
MLLEEELEELLLILEDKLEELLFSDELDEIPTELDELLMLDEELAIELIAWLLAELLIGVLLDELAPTIP